MDLFSRNGNAKCFNISFFYGIEHKDAACYSSLISGYGRNGSADEEIASVFIEMVLCQILQINLPSHHFSFLMLVLDS